MREPKYPVVQCLIRHCAFGDGTVVYDGVEPTDLPGTAVPNELWRNFGFEEAVLARIPDEVRQGCGLAWQLSYVLMAIEAELQERAT